MACTYWTGTDKLRFLHKSGHVSAASPWFPLQERRHLILQISSFKVQRASRGTWEKHHWLLCLVQNLVQNLVHWFCTRTSSQKQLRPDHLFPIT